MNDTDRYRRALEWYGEGNGDNGEHARRALRSMSHGTCCEATHPNHGRCQLPDGHDGEHGVDRNGARYVWPRTHEHTNWKRRAIKAEATIERLKGMFWDVALVLEAPLPDAPCNEPSRPMPDCSRDDYEDGDAIDSETLGRVADRAREEGRLEERRACAKLCEERASDVERESGGGHPAAWLRGTALIICGRGVERC